MRENISFLSLNIGNPSVERAKRQCEWLKNRPEDIFVLTETKNSQGCSYIEEYFTQYGYDLFSMNSAVNFDVDFPKSQTGDLGVMIISKFPIEKSTNCFEQNSIFYSRQTEVTVAFKEQTFSILGLYVPSRDRSEQKIERKRAFINDIEKYVTNSENVKRIVMGDFNILDRDHIPRYSTFFNWEYEFYDKIIEQGYIDTYKYCNPNQQDYSWVGRTNDGYRYDYCFVSTDLKHCLLECHYIHETRKMALTDHSAIVLKMII